MHPLVEKFKLQPHPEGGFYREVYRSSQGLVSPVHGQPRAALTHIYFLLLAGQVSRFHRVLHDEVWNHYAGAPLRLYDWHAQDLKEQCIGGEAEDFCAVIPASHFQAAESCGEYSFVGCSVAPGFDFADFSFIDDDALTAWLQQSHPQLMKFV